MQLTTPSEGQKINQCKVVKIALSQVHCQICIKVPLHVHIKGSIVEPRGGGAAFEYRHIKVARGGTKKVTN